MITPRLLLHTLQLLGAVVLTAATALGQSPARTRHEFRLTKETGLTVSQPRPSGNTVSVITVHLDTVLTANEAGLSITTDAGFSWNNLTSKDGIYKGSITAAQVHGSTMYVATLFDTAVSPAPVAGAGGGISYSTDFGATWHHIPQPVDTFQARHGYVVRPNGDTISITSVRTNIDNVTYDMAVTDSSIWIASFAGGIRMAPVAPDGTVGDFRLAAIPPDTLDEVRSDLFYDFNVGPFNDQGQQVYNHTAFSVLAASDGIWAGTAGGINFSTDGGLSWKRYTAQNSGLSGNFVVAITEQIYVDNGDTVRNLWAATNRAVAASEFNGVSVSADSGRTWRVVLQGPFVNNIACDGRTVYVATDDGMFRTTDLGTTWERFLTLVDRTTLDRTYASTFLTAGVDTTRHPSTLYFANLDVLAISDDGGASWRFARSFLDPGTAGVPSSYAAPSPFSSSAAPGITRFYFDHTGLTGGTDKATIKIYDFALDLVATVADGEDVSRTFVWNGLNNKGKRVANGTYVYTIEAGGKKYWGKVTVRQ